MKCKGNCGSLSLDLYDQWETMQKDGKWRFTSPTHVVLAFAKAMEELKETDIVCDYIVGSGAEVRDQKQQIVSTAPLSMELCEEIYENLKDFQFRRL